MEIRIKSFEVTDWPAVAEIYRQGILTRNATFETELPTYADWFKKFHPGLLWVATSDRDVAGWAGLQPVSTRKVYQGVVEVTVYVDPRYFGKHIGDALMKHLIRESEVAGIWTLYSSIFPENIASVRLHVKHGFREIGMRERIAKLEDKWRDTVLFERRSKIVGI